MGMLKAERVEDLELHDAVSSDDNHSHFLVGGSRVCRLIQNQVHERVVTSQDPLPEKEDKERDRERERAHREAKRTRWTTSISLAYRRSQVLKYFGEETRSSGEKGWATCENPGRCTGIRYLGCRLCVGP